VLNVTCNQYCAPILDLLCWRVCTQTTGGDWALDRFGAVFLEGTEQVTVQNCYFEQLDGNGLFMSGYNRNTTVYQNEFAWIGGNAMAQWGFTNDSSLEVQYLRCHEHALSTVTCAVTQRA
jgi:hypothetical protein